VFKENAEQEEVFETLKPTVEYAADGGKATFFAFG